MFNVTFSVSHPTEGTNDKLMLNGNHEDSKHRDEQIEEGNRLDVCEIRE